MNDRIKQSGGKVLGVQIDLSNRGLIEVPADIRRQQNIVTIDLSKNNLSKLPDWLFDIDSLHHLFVGYNNLTYLPEAVGNLQELRTLSIKRNRISELSGKAIAKLINLRSLNISHNSIRALPWEIGNLLHLKELILYGNNLVGVPQSVGYLVNTRIDIDDARVLRNAYSTELGTVTGLVRIPEKLKTALMQYLSFFHDYVLATRRLNIIFDVLRHVEGVEFRFSPTSEKDVEEVCLALTEFIDILRSLTGEIIRPEKARMTELEWRILEKDLKNEIAMLKLRLENSAFNISVLQDTNAALLSAVKHISSSAASISVVNTNNIAMANSFIQQYPELRNQVARFEEAISFIRDRTRDAAIENEIEKVRSLIEEVKTARTKDEVRQSGVINSLIKFAEKLCDVTTATGKAAAKIEGAASALSAIWQSAKEISKMIMEF